MKRITLPALYDHHSHFSLYAALSSMPSLAGVDNRTAASDIIRSSINKDLTIIRGWNSSSFSLSERDLGEKNPVIVLNLSLHGMIMNNAAMEFLSDDYPDLVRDHKDSIWMEKNLPRVLGIITDVASPSSDEISSFGESLLNAGISCMEDMLLPAPQWLTLISASPVMVNFWADDSVYRTLAQPEKDKIKGVKIFTDGALGTKTASLSEPYSSGEIELLLHEDEQLLAKLYDYMRHGIPVALHSIGDRATDQAVKAVNLIRRENGCGGAVRIEHAQFITRDNAFSAKDAGITLSMQPNFSDDSVMYADRLPYGFTEINNPFRMLIDDAGFMPGEDLLFGSDGMPHGMMSALQCSLFPPYAGQMLTLPEFKKGYCIPGAEDRWAVSIENRVVTVSPL